MSKKSALYLAAGFFLLAALALTARHFLSQPEKIALPYKDIDEQVAEQVDIVLRQKDKCGFETKIENEESCFCDVERKVNAAVDEIERLVRENPSLTNLNVVFRGKAIPIAKLSDERLPISPECNR